MPIQPNTLLNFTCGAKVFHNTIEMEVFGGTMRALFHVLPPFVTHPLQ